MRVYALADPPPPEPRYRDRAGAPVPSVTELIGREYGDPYEHVPGEVLEAACGRGTRVHEAIRAHLVGERETSLQLSDLGYFDAFLSWLRDVRLEPLLVERRFVVEGDAARGLPGPYAGTLDLAGMVFGRPTLPDWKCRAVKPEGAEPPDSVGAQTAGYEEAIHRAGLLPGPRRHWRRCAVELRKSGAYKVHWRGDRRDLDAFLRCLAGWYGGGVRR